MVDYSKKDFVFEVTDLIRSTYELPPIVDPVLPQVVELTTSEDVSLSDSDISTFSEEQAHKREKKRRRTFLNIGCKQGCTQYLTHTRKKMRKWQEEEGPQDKFQQQMDYKYQKKLEFEQKRTTWLLEKQQKNKNLTKYFA